MPVDTQVGPDAFVTLAYTLYDEDGDVIDTADRNEPLTYVHGYGQIVPGLEQALEGLAQGATRSVVVEPEDGYGGYDDEGVFEVDKDDFPNPSAVKIDDEFIAEAPDGDSFHMRVVEILPDAFVVDTNHPLAGEKLRFEVEILEVRPATDVEIAEAERQAEEHDEDHEHDGHACNGHSHHHHDEPDDRLVVLGRKSDKKDTPS
jgi:FKBP-type peptidyl-prolyl cis-trans isomerase SlyD